MLFAPPGQGEIEFLQGGQIRNGNQDVPADKPHQMLHRPLLVAASRIAEDALEEVVAAKGRELPVLLPVGSLEHLGDRRLEVVVNALPGNPAEELEGQTVPRQKRLQPFVGEGVDEGGSTATKPHAEQMHPRRLSPETHHRLPPIHLSLLSRGRLQGKEPLLRSDLSFQLCNDLADDGLAAPKLPLLHQPVVHPTSRMTLLAGSLEVLRKPGPDDFQIGPRDRTWTGLLEGVGGNLRILQQPADRLAAHPQLPGDLPDGPTFPEVLLADILPVNHPVHLLSSSLRTGMSVPFAG